MLRCRTVHRETEIDEAIERRPAAHRIRHRQTEPQAFGRMKALRLLRRRDAPVLRLTPPQRIAGLVRRPSRRFISMVSVDARQRDILHARGHAPGPVRGRRRTRRAGCHAARPAKRRNTPDGAASPGPRSRPSARGGVRRQHLGRARREVGDHRVHRHAAAGNHDPGLPGRAEIRVDAARCEGARDRKRGIFLAERAIGADGQQPLAARLRPVADRNVARRLADVDQPAGRSASPPPCKRRECRRAARACR